MATSGGLSTPESDQRISYYGITGYPTLVWQGTIYNVGAGTDVIDGEPYDAIVRSLLPSATPVKMAITDFSFSPLGPYVTVEIQLEDDIADITGHYIRVYVVEDDLLYGSSRYYDVLRDMLPQTALTISAAGQVQTETFNYTWDPQGQGWNSANMRVIAMVQRDSDKLVLQSCNSLPIDDYAFRFYALGDRVVVDSGPHMFDEFALFNVGNLTDTYELTFDTTDLPADWNVWFETDSGPQTSVTVSLAPGERTSYNVVIETASPGGGGATVTIHSTGGDMSDRQVPYSVITSDTRILLVDDDGAEAYETTYFAPALTAYGESFAIWDRGSAAVSGPILANFDAVVWNVGWAFPSLDADDRAALGTYLDGGGSLFISGQDIGWDMNDQGGAAYQWYRTYLHANYINDDTNDYTLDGVPSDPISDGISLTIIGGDGANNQDYPSDIDPNGAVASVIFTYDASRNGAIKADTGVHKVVYFAFGYEAINNATDRELVMQRVLDWLLPPVTVVGGIPSAAARLDQNIPNPFNPSTKICFQVGQTEMVSLKVFDLAGQLVRVLSEGVHLAGDYEVTWDGRDQTGRQISSGTYFYRLENEEGSLTRKMILVK